MTYLLLSDGSSNLLLSDGTSKLLLTVVEWIAATAGDWSTGSNWAGGSAPGSGDVAFFSDASIANCTVDADIDIGGLHITDDYTGTISGSTYTLTIRGDIRVPDQVTLSMGSADWTLAGGTSGSPNTMLIDQDITLSGLTVAAGSYWQTDTDATSGLPIVLTADTLTATGSIDIVLNTFVQATTVSVGASGAVSGTGGLEVSTGGTLSGSVERITLLDLELFSGVTTPSGATYNSGHVQVTNDMGDTGNTSFTFPSGVTITGDLVVTSQASGQTHAVALGGATLQGDLSTTGAEAIALSGDLTVSGTANQAIDIGSATSTVALEVDKASGNLSLDQFAGTLGGDCGTGEVTLDGSGDVTLYAHLYDGDTDTVHAITEPTYAGTFDKNGYEVNPRCGILVLPACVARGAVCLAGGVLSTRGAPAGAVCVVGAEAGMVRCSTVEQGQVVR